MDPFSISVGIIGVIAPTLSGVQLLYTELQKIVEAPNVVERLRDDLKSITASLVSIKQIEDKVWHSLGPTVLDQSRDAIESCQTACSRIRSNLQKWTKHSPGDKLSMRDRMTIGFFGEQQLKSLSAQIESHNGIFSRVVETAALYDDDVHRSSHR